MTTRTITVNTPEETEIQVCDECGLGDDDGEIIAFSADDPDVEDDVHYHRDCLREKTGNPQTLSEAYHEATQAEMEYEIAFVLSRIGEQVFLVSVALFAAGAIGFAFLPRSLLSMPIGISLSGVGLLVMSFCIWVGQSNGEKTAEELV